MVMTEQAESNGQAAAAPEPIQRGRYSIYEADDGGYVLAWQPDGSEETGRRHIPGWLVKMAEAQAAGEGGVMDKVKAAIGGVMNRGG